MTPAEELDAVADWLDALLAETTPGPWRLDRYGRSVEAPSRTVVAAVAGRELWPIPADAAYIAAMNPDVGRALAAVLRACAEDASGYEDAEPAYQLELALARAILGAGEAP